MIRAGSVRTPPELAEASVKPPLTSVGAKTQTEQTIIPWGLLSSPARLKFKTNVDGGETRDTGNSTRAYYSFSFFIYIQMTSASE